MTIRSKDYLKTRFQDNQTQNITAQDHEDFVDSVFGVGGGEANSGVDPQGNGSARNLEVGNGLTALGNRRLQVNPGADGLYRFEAEGRADIDLNARVRIAIIKNDIQSGAGAPDYNIDRDMVAGGKRDASNQFYLFEYHQCVEGDIVELDFVESGGANVFDADYVYTGHRIG